MVKRSKTLGSFLFFSILISPLFTTMYCSEKIKQDEALEMIQQIEMLPSEIQKIIIRLTLLPPTEIDSYSKFTTDYNYYCDVMCDKWEDLLKTARGLVCFSNKFCCLTIDEIHSMCKKWDPASRLSVAAQLAWEPVIEIYLEVYCKNVDVKDEINELALGIGPVSALARECSVSGIKLLMSKGASIEGVKGENMAPLVWAVSKGTPEIVEFILTYKPLIDRGATSSDADDQAYNGFTALHFATEFEKLGTVKVLLKHGANTQAVNDLQNETPLFLAVRSYNAAIVKALLEAGANPNAKNNKGISLVNLALYNFGKHYIDGMAKELKMTVPILRRNAKEILCGLLGSPKLQYNPSKLRKEADGLGEASEIVNIFLDAKSLG